MLISWNLLTPLCILGRPFCPANLHLVPFETFYSFSFVSVDNLSIHMLLVREFIGGWINRELHLEYLYGYRIIVNILARRSPVKNGLICELLMLFISG